MTITCIGVVPTFCSQAAQGHRNLCDVKDQIMLALAKNMAKEQKELGDGSIW